MNAHADDLWSQIRQPTCRTTAGGLVGFTFQGSSQVKPDFGFGLWGCIFGGSPPKSSCASNPPEMLSKTSELESSLKLHAFLSSQDSTEAEGDAWGEEEAEALELCQEETVEVPGEAEDQLWEDEELQEDEMELGEAVGEDGEPPPEEADSVWGCCNSFFWLVMSPALVVQRMNWALGLLFPWRLM